MSQQGDNDLVLIVNQRLIHNLALSVENQYAASIAEAVLKMQIAAAVNATVATWLSRGLEDPTEQMANIAMPIPRTLYATTNPLFNPTVVPGSNRETIINRLLEYDAVAPGPLADEIAPNADIEGVPLYNACPIRFWRDPGQRFTFFRDFHGVFPEPFSVEVKDYGLEVTFKGRAYQGDLFSRHLAMEWPTHDDIEMKLVYKVEFINNSDINLGPVPFRMVTNPPGVGPDAPSLPANDSFVFARRLQAGHFLLPTLGEEGEQPGGLGEWIFNGQLDDVIYESLEPQPFDPVPRYRVEPRSDAEPQRFVIRELGYDTILAEAEAGRLALRYDPAASRLFILEGDDLTLDEKNRILHSLSKIQPTLAQMFTCSAGLASAPVNLNLLELLGVEGMDIPIMPRSVVVPIDAKIVTPDNGLPGPYRSVWSLITHCDLTADNYFPGQSFGVSGKIGGSGDQTFSDSSAGADLTIGIGQRFMQPMLDVMADGVEDTIKANPPDGFDNSSLQVGGTISTDNLHIRATGEGEIEMPFFLPNIGYDFTADIYLRFRVQKAVEVDGKGRPRDRFGCLIPEEALNQLGLDVARNQLELPADQAGLNPLSFLAHFDPLDGAACFNCPDIEDFRVPPPVLNANLEEILVPDPENPPNICEDPATEELEQQPDSPHLFGQASFTEEAQAAGLKHQWVLIPIPPTDDDVDVDVDVNMLALFFIGLMGVVLLPGVLAFLGPAGAILAPIVAVVGITALFMLPFTNLIVSSIVTSTVVDKLAEANLPSFDQDLNPTSFLTLLLDEPGRPPFQLQGGSPGAFVMRFHVVVQSASMVQGT